MKTFISSSVGNVLKSCFLKRGPESAASEPPADQLEMQILKSHPRTAESETPGTGPSNMGANQPCRSSDSN